MELELLVAFLAFLFSSRCRESFEPPTWLFGAAVDFFDVFDVDGFDAFRSPLKNDTVFFQNGCLKTGITVEILMSEL